MENSPRIFGTIVAEDTGYMYSEELDTQSNSGSSSSPSLSTHGSLTTEALTSWIPPRSPPSPPYQYDPRCRVSSPDTPSPLFPRQKTRSGSRSRCQSDKDILGDGLLDKPRTGRHVQYEYTPSCEQGDARSRASSVEWDIASRPASPDLGTSRSHVQDRGAPVAPPRPEESVLQQSISTLHSSISNPSKPPQDLTRLTTLSSALAPFSSLTQRVRSASVLPSYSPPLLRNALEGAQIRARPGPSRAKLSRAKEPSSTEKTRRVAGKYHKHTRSYSVQWQQFERWQKKSKSRLRDLLILFIVIFSITLVIYQICTLKTKASILRASSSHAKRRRDVHESSSQKGLQHLDHPERDTIAVYRIIGNDLPPRHGQGQTLRNLRFMLAHENDFSFLSVPSSSYGLRVEKYYVLNRLTSTTTLDPILALFEEYGIPQERILNIPFEWHEYQKRKVRWDQGVARPDNLWGVGSGVAAIAATETKSPTSSAADKAKWQSATKLRAMEFTVHDKNLYAINNNGGRNFALDHGRNLAHIRWILPFDGNCFFTPDAMTSLLQSLMAEGEGASAKHYVTVPMIRLLDNGPLLDEPATSTGTSDPMKRRIEVPHAPEEPQVGFRWDAAASYQPDMRYGRRSKLELLWRLGAIPFSRNLHTKRIPWEITDRQYLTPGRYGSVIRPAANPREQLKYGTSNNDFIQAGWVHRLFSGEKTMEENTPEAQSLRKMSRMKGIITYLEKLDEQLVRGIQGCSEPGSCGFNKDKLWHWDVHELAELRNAARRQEISALKRVNDFSESVLELLDLANIKVRKLSTAAWNDIPPEIVAKDAAQLALAGYLASNSSFSMTAAALVRARFLPNSKDTPRRPLPNTEQAATEGSGYAFPLGPDGEGTLWKNSPHLLTTEIRYDYLIFEPSLLLDTLKLLSPAYQPNLSLVGSLPPAQIRSLFSHHLRQLLLSEAGMQMSLVPATLLQGARYDLSVAALAAFLNDARLLSRVVQRHGLRYIDSVSGEKRDDLDPADPDTYAALESVEAMYRGLDNVGYPSERTTRPSASIDQFFDI